MSTYMAKEEEVERKWYVVDAAGKTLGRLSTQIAQILTGKNKAIYTPHVDTGDFVIVINAEKVHLTGNKWQQKKFYRHSQYPGGLSEMTYDELRKKQPELMVSSAVKGMLPKNKLATKMFKKLNVYAGPEHPHQAQKPIKIDL